MLWALIEHSAVRNTGRYSKSDEIFKPTYLSRESRHSKCPTMNDRKINKIKCNTTEGIYA